MAHDPVAGTSLRPTTTSRAGPVADLDPRTRIAGGVVFAVAVVALQTIPALIAAVVVAVAAAWLARLPWRATRRKLLAMDGFILAMLVMLPFTTPGTPLASIGPLTLSAEGLHLAGLIALKANAIVLMLLALVGSLEPALLGSALRRLGVPLALVQLLVFTVRYIDVLGAEYARLRTAMRARGFRPRTDRHTLTTFGYLVGMLLVRASERAERVLQAMRCRGFDGTFPALEETRLGRPDGVGAAALAGSLALLLLTEHALGRLA
jgi:cobalt/nickel transport system permease protein